MTDLLIKAVKDMAALPDKDKISIRNKLYAPVSIRVQAFREAYGSKGRIITKIHHSSENRVLIEAQVSVLEGDKWILLANDFAEEFRGDGPVNKTSATENCSTSAIGRALSACGLSGGEYASFEEVDYAVNTKAEIGEAPKPKPEPKKRKPVKKKVLSEEEMKKALEEKGLIDEPKQPEETPQEMFKRISTESVKDMDQAASLADIEKIWKEAVRILQPFKKEIDETAWSIWIGHMKTLRNEMKDSGEDE